MAIAIHRNELPHIAATAAVIVHSPGPKWPIISVRASLAGLPSIACPPDRITGRFYESAFTTLSRVLLLPLGRRCAAHPP